MKSHGHDGSRDGGDEAVASLPISPPPLARCADKTASIAHR
jgi:hypothetical protein